VDYRGSNESLGKPYSLTREDVRLPLKVKGSSVGALILRNEQRGPVFVQNETALSWRAFTSLIVPVGIIAFFTGLMTVVIGLILMRRIVSPLVDVIAAAQSVAGGDLTTRVTVKGRGDLRDLSESFNHMADSLERNDRERREWLADIAHELRTPLTIMRGRLEGIVDKVYPASDEHIAPVLEETYTLERLVDDLHLLSLAESRQLHFDIHEVDLAELVRRAVTLFEMSASEKNIRLTVEAESDVPTVSADPQRMGQVIGNLLNNAIQYVPEGGQVDVRLRRSALGVAVSVSDNGVGVPDTDLPKMFDRFWRGEKSRARVYGGAGLGLAIARQLVEGQGGTIVASRASSGGLQIEFELKKF
jgi:two-component system OmpR family sensor kinase/two-component system sensor histidine kinase BaeS